MSQENIESDEDTSSEYDSWISWFCNQKGCEFFCEVEEEYIESNFNLYGLRNEIPNYRKALQVILDQDNPDDNDDVQIEQNRGIHEDAAKLYGMIHARYIITKQGLERMRALYQDGFFGRCPRVHCGTKVLPIGQSDVVGINNVKVFCAQCCDIYHPRSNRYKRIDGAFFGTSFPHLFLMQYPDLMPKKKSLGTFDPRIFGFKLHDSAKYFIAKKNAKVKKSKNKPLKIKLRGPGIRRGDLERESDSEEGEEGESDGEEDGLKERENEKERSGRKLLGVKRKTREFPIKMGHLSSNLKARNLMD